MLYRDSLRGGSASNQIWAKQIVINVGLDSLVDDVTPSNRAFQPDGWSCGLWCLKWIEMDLRYDRGEAPSHISTQVIAKRVNHFIDKVKDKAKIAPAASLPPVPAALEPPAPKWEGPKHATLEDALDAAVKCKKCLPTKLGTKGCSSCMGEWFEEIRQSRTSEGYVKRLFSKK